VQNREKEKDAASSPSYDVSSHVPSLSVMLWLTTG
jgi:hypothetical protein